MCSKLDGGIEELWATQLTHYTLKYIYIPPFSVDNYLQCFLYDFEIIA